MRRFALAALVSVLPLVGCSSDDFEPEFTPDPFTLASMPGTVLGFVPDTPVGGIDRWEYEFSSSGVRGCNVERTYDATGWSLVDDRTVRVNFGSQWEQYRLVNYNGTVEGGDLAGTFEYTSSPGVTMTGTVVQQSSTIFC